MGIVRKLIYYFAIILMPVFLAGCNMPFSGGAEPRGPDSGEEIDLSDEEDTDEGETDGPDSGEEVDTSEPSSPDSGDEIDPNEPTSPDSGDEIDPSEPTSPDSGDEVDPNEPTSPDSGDEVDLTEELRAKVKGSCNAIASVSTCVDYVGSYFATWKNIELHCSGSAGVVSKKPCPSSAFGGCRAGVGTSNENIVWVYGTGGEPFSAEEAGYFKKSCTAVPGTAWIGM